VRPIDAPEALLLRDSLPGVSPFVTVVLPAAILGLAYTLARRELALYRAAAWCGAWSGSACWWRTAGAASLYLGAIVGEVAVLLLLPVVDMWATARMVKMVKAARARRSATGRGASDPRTGSSPDRPR